LLASRPVDIALHEAYQNARLGGMEINRPDLIAEYEQLLAKHANDSVFLYLAAEAQMGRKTKEAIAKLQRAIELSPGFGLPHLLLAQIYFSHAYENTAEVNRRLGRFAELCPASVRALGIVKWSKDKELIAREAARLRHNIEVRTDSEAVATYPTLWSFEGVLERSDQQSENLARMRHDLDRLFTPAFARNSVWLATIEATDFFDGASEGLGRRAQHEVAALYPNSEAALRQKNRRAGGLPQCARIVSAATSGPGPSRRGHGIRRAGLERAWRHGSGLERLGGREFARGFLWRRWRKPSLVEAGGILSRLGLHRCARQSLESAGPRQENNFRYNVGELVRLPR
jgi:tetratricopeptide (TPR) repeat protein